jgi:hypothetical protein
MITNVGSVGIRNASRFTIEEAVMPAPTGRSILAGWLRPITLVRVVTTTVDFETAKVEKPLKTTGVVQPLTATALAIKPEGQRTWKWWMITATPELILKAGEDIIFRGSKLRIMSQVPLEANDVIQYEAVEDYESD